MSTDPIADRTAPALLNSLGIYGPNIRHIEQGMWPDGKHSVYDTWDGPGWCVCGRIWPCEALALGLTIEAYEAVAEAARECVTTPPHHQYNDDHAAVPLYELDAIRAALDALDIAKEAGR